MKKYSSVIAWAAIVLIMAVFALVMVLSDDEGSSLERDDTYYIQEYAVRYEHESGRSFRVTEEITAVFNQPGKHGIIRDLPYNSGEGYAGISSDDVFDVQTSSSFISVYLGDPYATVPRGEPVTYSLEYTFKLPSSAGKETVYINLVGAGWTTDIRSAVCTLVLPEAPENILINNEDFTGGYTVNGNEVTVTAKGLSAFTPVTLRCSLDKGALGGYAPDGGEIAALLIAAALLAGAIVAAVLLPKNDPTPVVSFTPPDGVDPLLAGSMIDGSVQDGDITALIYYWAYKRKLTIDLTDESDPVLHKIGDLDTGVPEHERVVFERIFQNGNTVAISSLSNTFWRTAAEARALAAKKTPKMFSSKSSALAVFFAAAAALLFAATVFVRGLHIHRSLFVLWGLAGVIPVAAVYALGYWYRKNSLRVSAKAKTGVFVGQVAIAAAATAFAFFLIPQLFLADVIKPFFCLLLMGAAVAAPLVIRRRKAYVDALNPLLGFREFIRLAEKERLEMLLEQDPEFYYNILPYAQVLGVSDIWEEKFKDIKMDPPAWAIAPNNTLFDFVVFNAALRGATRSMSTAFVSRPSSAGKSGGGRFGGGGGFRGGGGFGGGGGRSW